MPLAIVKIDMVKKTDVLVAEPGTIWDYSDPAMAHLSIFFKSIMKQEMH
jgi:hypothetical protein